MTKEREQKTGGEAQGEKKEAGHERPTVAPAFDPVFFAQQVQGGRPSPAAGTPTSKPAGGAGGKSQGGRGPHARGTPRPSSGRGRTPTLTDPEELERARQRSVASQTPSRPTPQGLLSMANARVPSNLPPRNAGAFQAEEPERQELATRPPPPMQQGLIESSRRAPGAAAAATAPPPIEAPPTTQEMKDRVALGDYSGALQMAEQLLAIDGSNHAARACAESCRSVLRQMFTARIGPLDRVPLVMVSRDQLRWLSIDHRAGFVLSLVDGVSSLEMILDVSGMPELDALRILSELAHQRIISFR